MTLIEVLADLNAFDDESLVVTAKGITPVPETLAMVVPIPSERGVEPEPPGFDYLIEVYHAKDVLETWSAWRDNRTPTPVEAIEAIVYYQEHDEYLPAPPE